MKRDNLQDIWHKGSSNIEAQSSEDLKKLLEKKVVKAMRKHSFINYISILVGVTLFVLLIYSGIKRANDTYYLINNMVLCFIVAVFVVSGIRSHYKMNYNTMSLPLRDWLRYRINEMSKSQKMYPVRYFLAILMILPCYLSFFVYSINRSFLDVVTNEAFFPGFLIVFISGSFSSFLAMRNVSLYKKKILKSLQEMYAQLCEQD
ncbi:hypothetical protein [Dysgonomonas mossii]|uniref:hypothetical protein n=1 Tax=Dysgonomonas mossii TaxID=163665 RepID=UPI003994034E